MLTRTQRFIEDNQKLILLGCAVAASAGVGYYLYTSRQSSSPPGSPGPSGSKRSKRSKKKKGGSVGGSRDEKFLRSEGKDGPLLEEIPGKAEELAKEMEAKAVEETRQEPGTSHLNGEFEKSMSNEIAAHLVYRCTR